MKTLEAAVTLVDRHKKKGNVLDIAREGVLDRLLKYNVGSLKLFSPPSSQEILEQNTTTISELNMLNILQFSTIGL